MLDDSDDGSRDQFDSWEVENFVEQQLPNHFLLHLEVKVPARVKAILVAGGVDRDTARALARYVAKSLPWAWTDERDNNEKEGTSQAELAALRSVEAAFAKHPGLTQLLNFKLALESGVSVDLEKLIHDEASKREDGPSGVRVPSGGRPKKLKATQTIALWRYLKEADVSMNRAAELIARIYLRFGVVENTSESRLAASLRQTIRNEEQKTRKEVVCRSGIFTP